jgi:cytochrome c556
MRIAPLVFATFVVLVACSGADSSQASNAQANLSNAAAPVATATATASVVTARVSGADAAKVMHERHEGMEAIGKANKAIKREVGGDAPDLATIRPSAAKIADLSQKASGWFPAGTGPDVGKTGAKPEIWQNQADFMAKLRNFQKAAQAFNTAASGGDAGVIKARFADMGGTCKACHDKYRTEMHH